MSKKTYLWGLVDRRERIGLSLRGWVLLLVLGVGGGWLFAHTIRPFLAKNQRVPSDILVMEGWIHPYAVNLSAAEFKQSGCPKIYVTGGPATGMEGETNDWNTYANIGAQALAKAGVAWANIQKVPANETMRDRTYSSAVALRQWFLSRGMTVTNFNIITEDAHARRTCLLFQKAFGPAVTVGVITIPDPDYDPAHWWRYSEGVRVILGETIAYLYAQLLFHPDSPPL